MTTLSIARSQPFAVRERRSHTLRVPLLVWNSILVAVIALLGAWYLTQVNVTMSRGYQIRDAQNRVNELQAQARMNQIKLSEMETVDNLTSQAASLGMVPVGQVEYVTTPTTGVALR